MDGCTPAFEALAHGWGRLEGDEDADPAIYPTAQTVGHRVLNYEIEEIILTREVFCDWVISKDYDPPHFWSYRNMKFEGTNEQTGTPKKASSVQIDQAITETYDQYSANGWKPPNLAEIGNAALETLKAKGLTATKNAIQKAADAPKHAKRRRSVGKALKSERKSSQRVKGSF